MNNLDILKLREAIEASWAPDTAYRFVEQSGNPALGQCYPTSRTVQYYLPEAEIVEGTVTTAKGDEKHFWNVLDVNGTLLHIDMSWQQFPPGSVVKEWKIRDRTNLNDSEQTVARVELLMSRVKEKLGEET